MSTWHVNCVGICQLYDVLCREGKYAPIARCRIQPSSEGSMTRGHKVNYIIGSYVLKILRVCCGKKHQPGLALGIGLICLMITLQRDLFVLPTSALTGNRNQYYQIISKGHGHENAGARSAFLSIIHAKNKACYYVPDSFR